MKTYSDWNNHKYVLPMCMFAILLTVCLEVGLETLLEKLIKLTIDNLNSFKKNLSPRGQNFFHWEPVSTDGRTLEFFLPLAGFCFAFGSCILCWHMMEEEENTAGLCSSISIRCSHYLISLGSVERCHNL